jgi:hypothetical protein
VVLPSNGDRTLAATITYLRPIWVFKKYQNLTMTTPWLDWPQELRSPSLGDHDRIASELRWKGWASSEPIDESDTVLPSARLGRFLQTLAAPSTALPRGRAVAPGSCSGGR